MTSSSTAVILSNAHRVGDQRIARWVTGLRGRGYSVQVVALDEPAAGDADALWGDSSVAVVRLGPVGRLGRIGRALPLALRHRGDVVVAVDPELFGPVSIAQRLRRGQSVSDVHEDFPALAVSRASEPAAATTAATSRFGSFGTARAVLRRWALRGAARLVTRSASWADITVVADDHVPPFEAHTRVVGRNQPGADDDAALAPLWRHDSGQPLPVVYAGGLTATRGGFAMLEALSLSTGWTLDLFGPATPALAEAITQAAEAYPERLRWWGPIPNRRLRTELGAFAIGLCPLACTPAYAAALPAKITEYHHAGLGIVATDLPRIKQRTRDPQSSVLVNADGDVASSIAAVLGALAVDSDAVQALQLAARTHRAALDEAGSLPDAIGRLPLGSRQGPGHAPIAPH